MNAVGFPAVLLALAACGCQGPGPSTAEDEDNRPNILVYMIDTLRAREIGAYGATVTRTPAMDRFARESTLFERARTPSSWTRPAVASLLTGVPPEIHGINTFPDVLAECGSSLPRLPELLQGRGYFTGAVVANPQVDPIFGFEPGFDSFQGLYEDRKDLRSPSVEDMISTAPTVVDAAKDFIRAVPDDQPYFLFVLSIDPHGPYEPPPPFDTMYDPREVGYKLPGEEGLDEIRRRMEAGRSSPELLARYRGEVSYADAAFGDLLAWMGEESILDDTLVVLTADHGEEFAEHGDKGHGKTLFEEVVHVPLVLRHPGSFDAGRRRAENVDLMDLAATLAALGGAPVPESWAGRDLRGPLEQGVVVSSSLLRHPHYYTAVVRDRLKLIENELTGRTVLLDLDEDPWELRPLDPDRRPEEAASLLRALEAHRQRSEAFRERLGECPSSLGEGELPEETRRRLETLGYVEEPGPED